MKIAKRIVSLLILFAASTSSHATFDNAIEHYEAGAYKQAFMEFQALAEIGHKGAQFNLGVMYLEGTGVQADPVKAYAWIKLADKQAQKEHEFLNEIHQQLNEEQRKEAEFYFNSLDKSFSEEVLKLALEPIYKPIEKSNKVNKSSGMKPVRQKPPSYPREAAYQGVEGWVITSFYLNEEGFPSDISVIESFPGDVFVKNSLKAIEKWQFEVPENYDRDEQYKYKLQYQLAGGATYKNALNDLKQKAEKGDAKSQYLYAKFSADMLPEDDINPTIWYYKAAEQGIANAQFELANNLLEGEGCEEDKEKAIAWLIKSASGNLGRSHFKLAKLFLQLEDKERAYFWLDKAINANDPVIAFELAKFIDELGSEQYQLGVIRQVLEKAETNTKVSPIRFYEYFADVAARMGDYDSAAKYQFKANMSLKRIANVPEEMRTRLDEYQALRDKK